MTEPSIRESTFLHERVRAEIARFGPHEPSDFDELALAIARFQTTNVAVVQRLVEARGVDASTLQSIDDFPAVPTDVFRLKRVAAHPAELDVRTFRTSGTTAGKRGAHAFRDLTTYEQGALAFGTRMLWPDGPPDRVIVLAPSASEVPDSSLSFMIDSFADHLGVPTSHHVDPEGIAWPGLLEAIAEARGARAKVLLFGTSFAFVFLLDELETRGGGTLALPPGSRAMLTGGFKGRSREVDEHDLRAMLTRGLGLSPDHIIGEYGMTELSSQLYEPRLSNQGSLYVAPPWVRVTAVDPVTLSPVGEGRRGLCRVVDLANVDSAIAIQTSDLIEVTPRGILLLGRAQGAMLRGCSLAIEEIVGGSRA